MAYCDPCNRYFAYAHSMQQHLETSPFHHYCQACSRDFDSAIGLEQHYVQSQRHAYCKQCDEHFDSRQELELHYNNAHWFCGTCRRFFQNDHGLHEHRRQSHGDVYCAQCKRLFQNGNNFRAHMNSSTHRPRDVRCPFNGCSETFISRSAMILHLESGGCRSGVTRSVINRYVREYDKSNVITDPSRMITSGSSHDNTTYYATSAAWNGYGFECYLCHGEYRSLQALNQHLASPRHQDKIYVCPLQSCRQHFGTLSALCQHIESERCGVAKFRAVQNAMNNIVGRMGRLTM